MGSIGPIPESPPRRNEEMAKSATAPTPKAAKVHVRPLGDKVLVRRDDPETKTSSGIFLPETGKEKPKSGVIQAVGDGAINTDTGERIPLSVKKGDRVIFSSYAGTEVKLE